MQVSISIDTDLKYYLDHQYNSGNYREAIIQAMHCLTDVIRNISGSMLDGEKLVQKAFEGSSPLIKLSKLISE